MDTSKPWEFSCSPEQFLAIRSREDFAALVALARAVSHVRWAAHTLDSIPDGDQSPYAKRQQTGALITLAASLHEALELTKHHVGRHFRAHPAFPPLAELWKDSRYRQFADGAFADVRNQFVSHFDPSGAAKLLADLEYEDRCIFTSGVGDDAVDEHHTLADALAMLSLVGRVEDWRALEVKMSMTMPSLGRMVGEFIRRADRFIKDALPSFGFEARNA